MNGNVSLDFFDQLHQRRGSDSLKWDAQSRVGGDNQEGLPMWVADGDFAAPPVVVDALRQRLQLPLGYSHGDSYVASVAAWLKQRHQWQVESEWLLPINSTMAAMAIAVQACSEPGEQLIIQPPIYPPFYQLADQDRQLVLNPLVVDADGVYRFDYPHLERQLSRQTRALALCHPQNPGGRNWSPAELQPLLDICRRQRLTLITDAIHCDLVLAGGRYHFPAQIDAEINQQSITIVSPNKCFNIAGLSSACAIIPNPKLRQRFNKLTRYYHLDELNLLAKQAAVSAYQYGEPWLEQLLRYLDANQRYLLDFIAAQMPLLQVQANEATFLSWIDCRRLGTEKQVAQTLNRQVKLTLNPGSSYGEHGRGYFRLNFACPRATLNQGLERLLQAYRLLTRN